MTGRPRLRLTKTPRPQHYDARVTRRRPVPCLSPPGEPSTSGAKSIIARPPLPPRIGLVLNCASGTRPATDRGCTLRAVNDVAIASRRRCGGVPATSSSPTCVSIVSAAGTRSEVSVLAISSQGGTSPSSARSSTLLSGGTSLRENTSPRNGSGLTVSEPSNCCLRLLGAFFSYRAGIKVPHKCRALVNRSTLTTLDSCHQLGQSLHHFHGFRSYQKGAASQMLPTK